jgi:AraC-like DNA-binding protein
VQRSIGDTGNLHGIDLPDHLCRLLADYLDLLALRLPGMPEDEAAEAADDAIEMIASCLRPSTKAIDKAELQIQKPQIQKILLLRAKRTIEENLRSPRLNPEYLCATLRVSRRSLYRLFEPFDGIHRYILSRRLAAIMTALRDESGNRRIADIAADYGFTTQETFWRAFKRQFDTTPGEARSHASPYRSTTLIGSESGFDQLLRQLNA